MATGGYRAGAGRKPDAVKAELRKLLDKHVSEDELGDVLNILACRARSGDVNAAALLLGYRFGKPTETVIVEDDAPDQAEYDYTRLTPEELAQLESLLIKAAAPVGSEGGAGAR